MKRSSRANKGQFSVIAALLVSVILVSAVISSYTLVRHAPLQGSPKVLSAIGEMNANIKSILDFTVGYYGSILKVTGNSTYAKGLTTSYLSSGLVNIARSHPEWNPSFTFDFDADDVSTSWFMPESYSMGHINVTYSLAALGIAGVKYETSSALTVELLESEYGIARINVTRDNAEPELGLTKENFWFYSYSDEDSTWELINPTDMIISSNGVYTITIPAGVDPDSYSVQVEDNRGIIVPAFYSQESVTTGIPHYTYTFDWAATGVLDIYEDLSTDTFVIEVLQNGTLKWLGQDLELTTPARAIPPVSVKALRVNATISGVNQEVPFQVEDWASDYMIPLGLAGNDSIFNNNNMLVFLVNNEISEVTVWWNGNDTAIQTPYAWENIYFNDDVSDPDDALLYNGNIYLNVKVVGSTPRFEVTSTVGSTSSTAEFLRVNGDSPVFWADTAYVIYNGIVRDIIQQEPEYSGGVSGCPNFYSQIVLTFPANTNYYTYALRTIFVDSVQSRTVNDLSAVQLSVPVGTPMTEDGTSGGYPVSSSSTGLYYDGSPTGWDHHWSQFVSGSSGAGVMFTDTDNQNLYMFDTTDKTGALNVQSDTVEVNPVERYSVSFTDSLDATWRGAVVTFNGESIYNSGDDVGLWVMVESPPVVALDEYLSEYDLSNNYVDNNISNVDSSVDTGSHSAFSAQKAGPDSVCDTLTEENTGGSSIVTLIDAESFEGSWPPSGWTEEPSSSAWNAESNRAYDGSRSADFDGDGSGISGNLVTGNLDCSDAFSIFVSFRYYDEGLDPNEFLLEYFDGSSWVNIADLGTLSGGGTWSLYEQEITDSRYFVSDFRIRWRANDVEGGGSNEHAYVDLVTVTKVATAPVNYKLDLEVQWTSVDYDETNEELCIYVGGLSGEALGVDVWTGSAWTPLFASLNVGWNNATVSSYLTASTFTIRFVGTTETGDSVQDYWTIDATLLHLWS